MIQLLLHSTNGNPVALFDAGSAEDDAITGISLMPNGALVVAGNYNGTIDFGNHHPKAKPHQF